LGRGFESQHPGVKVGRARVCKERVGLNALRGSTYGWVCERGDLVNHVKIEVTEALNDLVTQIKQGECILFLGAGVHSDPKDSPYTYSEEHRPLLGGDLAEILAGECGFTRTFPDESPRDLQRVSLCFETTPGLGRKRLVDHLDKHLRAGKKPSPALEMLAGLPFRIFVTTNYDRLLESALYKLDKDPYVFVYSPHEGEPTPDLFEDPTEERPLLFKMHGDLDQRDSIVVTDEDYITFVQRMSDKDALHPVPQTVRFRMRMWPTLFVGYSLRDYNLRLLLRTLRWRVDPAYYPPTFSVDKEPDPLILKVWQDERKFVTFVAEDLWAFVPWLFKEIRGKEYPP